MHNKQFFLVLIILISLMASVSMFASYRQAAEVMPVDMFISLETNDSNLTVIECLAAVLDNNIIAIVSSELFHQLFNFDFVADTQRLIGLKAMLTEARSKIADDKQWSMFINTAHDIVVLIPAKYHKNAQELGFAQDLQPIDYQALGTLPQKDKDKSTVSVDNFIHLFNSDASVHRMYPKRIWLEGHGKEKTEFDQDLMCGMRLHDMARMLSFFNTIHAEFLYVVSCYSSGENLIRLRNKELFTDNGIEYPISDVRYPIVFQASSDCITVNILERNCFSDFFDALNFFLINRKNFKGDIKSLKRSMNVFFKAQPVASNISSLCVPGGRFRSIGYQNVFNIDYCVFAHHRMTNRVINIPEDTQFLTVAHYDLSDATLHMPGSITALFISKIPGNAQHIIGTLKVPDAPLVDIIKNSFFRCMYDSTIKDCWDPKSGKSDKAWFISNLIAQERAYQGFVAYKKQQRWMILYKYNDQYHLRRGDDAKVIPFEQYYALLAAICYATMPEATSFKESSLGFEEITNVNNQPFNNFLYSFGLDRLDLVSDQTIKAAQELLLSDDEYIASVAEDYFKWLGAIHPKSAAFASGRTDRVLDQCNTMLASEDKKIRADGIKLYCAWAQAESSVGNDKQLRTRILEVMKEEIISRRKIDLFLDMCCNPNFDKLLSLNYGKEFIQLAYELLTSSIPDNVMGGLWIVCQLAKKGLLQKQDLENQIIVDAACWVVNYAVCFCVNAEKLDETLDGGRIIIDLCRFFIKNECYKPTYTITGQLLQVYKRDNVEQLFHQIHECQCAQNSMAQQYRLANRCMNLEFMFKEGIVLYKMLIRAVAANERELDDIVDEYIKSPIIEISKVGLQGAAKLLADGFYPITQLPFLKEKAVEISATLDSGPIKSLTDTLIKLKMFDQAYELAANVRGIFPLFAAEIFIQLIRNNYVPPLEVINQMIDKLNAMHYPGQAVKNICAALLETKKSELVSIVQERAARFVCDEKLSDTGICLFARLIKAGFQDKAAQVAQELISDGKSEFLREQGKKLEKLMHKEILH